EASLPEFIAHKGCPVAFELVLIRAEYPAHEWSRSQGGKEARERIGAIGFLSTGAGQEVEASRAAPVAYVLEEAALLAPLGEIRQCDPLLFNSSFRIALPEHDKFPGLFVGKGLQQNSIDYTEDRGIGPDSEGECDDRHCGKSGLPGEHACAKAEVMPH